MDDQPTIDSHAHVWDRTCSFVAGSRYRPDYEATIGAYLDLLDHHHVERAVLVQPSFLGTDNGYLLAALAAHPDRLRGIVVVEPSVADATLDEMSAAGVIGLRYNLLSLDPGALHSPAYRDLTRRAAGRGWWVEVQAQGADWPHVLPALDGARLMIDHFGRPSGPDCPGLAALLTRPPGDTVVKLSAPYRQTLDDMAPVATRLIARFGAERCLWGSDWPWTQHEGRHDYGESLGWLGRWTSPAERRAMAAAAPGLARF